MGDPDTMPEHDRLLLEDESNLQLDDLEGERYAVNEDHAAAFPQPSQKLAQDAVRDEDEEAERLQAEEGILNNHLECVKQEAYLITVEGEMITKLENAMMNDEAYDMGAYLASSEEIARKKLAMYSELLNNISAFKQDFMAQQDGAFHGYPE